MAEPLARADLLVWIFYGMFTFRDAWCDAGDDGEAMSASRETVVAASTYLVAAQALSHRARLTVRVWPEQPPPEKGWDGGHEMRLHCPTGEMLAEQVTAGGVDVLRLPEAGVYGLRASWRGREATWAEITRVIGDEEAVERTHGKEQFLFDMWREGPLPPDDDDEDFAEEVAHPW